MPAIYSRPRRKKTSSLVQLSSQDPGITPGYSRKFGAVIGHSFVKNIKRYVRGRLAETGKWQRIQTDELWEPAQIPEVLRLDKLFAAVAIRWAYLFESPEWNWELGLILAASPQILCVNIGSNDICNIMRASPNDSSGDKRAISALVKRLVVAACEWRDGHNVNQIIFMSVLRRVSGYKATEYRFTRNMGWFNDELNRWIDFEPGMTVKNVKGFDCHPDGSAMRVEDWSPDGAHPGTNFEHESFRKYLQEIHAALFSAVPKIKD